jgi:hypothetical protein
MFQPSAQRARAMRAVLAISLAAMAGSAAAEPAAPPGITVSVGLEQGVVDVKSTQGPLGLYREKVVKPAPQDFDAFKREMADGVRKEQEAFRKYKEQITREFVGYVESVTLQAGTELTISGNTAVERQAAPQDNAARDFMKRWRAEGDSKHRPGQ